MVGVRVGARGTKMARGQTGACVLGICLFPVRVLVEAPLDAFLHVGVDADVSGAGVDCFPGVLPDLWGSVWHGQPCVWRQAGRRRKRRRRRKKRRRSV